ncbi:MAG TPA: FtsX-like permease family protein, partial [Nocardioidaceae bacterium]|nr:FtsX-like permease family protein [Nocardioidaceae bacterium]
VEVERDPLPPTLVDRVEQVAGVAEARPAVKGSGLLEYDGRPIVPSGPSMLTSWAPAPFGAFSIRSGRPPQGTGEVVVDVATARDHGIEVGDTVTVRATRSAKLEVVGLAGFGDGDGLPNTTVALVDLAAAQSLLELGDGVSEIQVLTADETSASQVQGDLGAALGGDYEIASSQDIAGASASAAKTQLSYLRLMLFVLAGAALLIGGFLIANTFSVVISQRTRELAMLRAVGATGRQVVASVLGEAVVLGLVGSALGVGLGVVAAIGLRQVVGAFGIALPDAGLVVLPRTVVVAFVIGIVVTVLAAAGPSRRAARVAPVEAMRQSDAVSGVRRTRVIAGAVAAVVAVAALGAVLAELGPVLLIGVAGVFGVLALGLLGPVLAPLLTRTVGRPLDATGVPGALARQSTGRAPRRTAATVLALALSLALISFMAIVATSIKGAVSSSYREVVSADFVVESARGEMLGGLAPHTFHRVEGLDEVATASRMRYGHWKDGERTSALTAIDPATLPDVANLDMVAGSLSDLADGGIVLAEQEAVDRGLEVGDRVPMTFSRTGAQALELVGLVADEDAQALSTGYLISLETFRRHFTENVDATVFVKVADGVSAAAARAALDDALAGIPTAEVRDQAAAVEGRTAGVDQILGLVTVLLLFTVLIALLGITNTLALSIVERTREIGLLRAVGMTQRQLRAMVRAEAALIAGAAVVVGLALGAAFGAGAVSAFGRTSPVALSLPAGQLLLVVVAATVAGVAAGSLPARRAARLDVLEAISAE